MGAFTVMDFDDPDDPSVAYVETRTSVQYLEKPHEVGLYRDIFAWLVERSVPVEEYRS